ncbi:hypothetical protein PHPALM_29935 [Phytophthora palmivora]|uniref:SCP domain-containing protein n=1 Tax=Phytophthora palmivora TaxID=4796 RepID=A0A2P4X6D5_9STRA|nr:hypothetical protein PHPALM_29935 [Phytophthora palmivora]
MSHTGSDGSSMSQRITAAGFAWTAIAENVAAGQKDVTAVMKSWMNSAGHKKNILSTKYKMFGCGYAYNSKSTYKHYWTQDFGASSSESCSTTPSSSSQGSSTTAPTTQKPTPTPTTAIPATKAPTTAPSTSSSSTMQTQMLVAVNKQRATAGLPALCMNSKLQSAAQGHSNDMAANDFMSHTGSNGSTMSQRITAAGYAWNSIAENVAAGQTNVDAVMTAWMNSPGHKANILSSKVTMFGCAYAYNAGRHSNDMAANDFMSHTGSNGSTMSQRITAAGYAWNSIAENVAAGQTNVDAVMTAWMNSPGHKANILSSKVTMFGCAYAYNAGSTYKHYWTQDFGMGTSESCSS